MLSRSNQHEQVHADEEVEWWWIGGCLLGRRSSITFAFIYTPEKRNPLNILIRNEHTMMMMMMLMTGCYSCSITVWILNRAPVLALKYGPALELIWILAVGAGVSIVLGGVKCLRSQGCTHEKNDERFGPCLAMGFLVKLFIYRDDRCTIVNKGMLESGYLVWPSMWPSVQDWWPLNTTRVAWGQQWAMHYFQPLFIWSKAVANRFERFEFDFHLHQMVAYFLFLFLRLMEKSIKVTSAAYWLMHKWLLSKQYRFNRKPFMACWWMKLDFKNAFAFVCECFKNKFVSYERLIELVKIKPREGMCHQI